MFLALGKQEFKDATQSPGFHVKAEKLWSRESQAAFSDSHKKFFKKHLIKSTLE